MGLTVVDKSSLSKITIKKKIIILMIKSKASWNIFGKLYRNFARKQNGVKKQIFTTIKLKQGNQIKSIVLKVVVY